MQILMRYEVVPYDSAIIHTNENIYFILSSLTFTNSLFVLSDINDVSINPQRRYFIPFNSY